MKCPSLFHFYRAYFGGKSQGKVHFARAINETGRQLETTFEMRNWQNISKYIDRERAFQLTKIFLGKFQELAEQHYGKRFFDEVQWLKNRILLPKESVGRKEVYIPFSYCYAARENILIFVEFGKLEEASRWLPIFKTLTESFLMDDTLPDIDIVTYWDLMKGTTNELLYPETSLAPKERVLQTARKLVEQSSGAVESDRI